MTATVRDILGDKKPTCVPHTMPVREAVRIMLDGDFSQLPILDSAGKAIGLFTDRKLAQAIFMGMGCQIDDLPVSQWMDDEPVKFVDPDYRLHKAAHLLADHYALVVGENNQVVGIVTDYDIAVYLAEWSHGNALVEDIEGRLRGYIKRVLPTKQARDAALHSAFGHDRQDPNQPAKKYERLSLYDHVQLIIANENWPKFEPFFRSKRQFTTLLNKAVDIRDQMAHYRGALSPAQVKSLDAVRSFLVGCPLVPEPVPVAAESLEG